MTKKETIKNYLLNQTTQIDSRIKSYIFDKDGKYNEKRDVFFRLKEYIDSFLKNNSDPRWIIMPGLRGVGKTTLLAQLYNSIDSNIKKIYISADRVIGTLETSLNEILTNYEELIGSSFEKLEKPLFIFLDEAQYDPKWGIVLKTIYDRSDKIFIITTGSSALDLGANSDIARRAIFENIYPMTFGEYINIKYKIKSHESIDKLKQEIFFSNSAQELYDVIESRKTKINEYWSKVDQNEINKYLKYGTLPFTIKFKNEGLIYDQIIKIIERIINLDIKNFFNFKNETISQLSKIIYALSNTDVISISKFAGIFNINKETLFQIMESLEKTQILNKIYPHGSNYSQIKKPSKYLFLSPAFRSAYFNTIGNSLDELNYMGRLLEDTVGLYLYKFLKTKPATSFTYDNAQSGADFIVTIGDQKIIFEVGTGSKDARQIMNTAKKVKAKYGINISNNELSLDVTNNIVNIPINYFLIFN